MKCYFCNNDAEILTTDGKNICRHCAEEKNFTVCTKLGKVIADKNFHCDIICNDCIYEEDKK